MRTGVYSRWSSPLSSSTKTYESVNVFPFSWNYPLFSKVFHEDSPFSEEYGHCSLFCTFTMKLLTLRLEDWTQRSCSWNAYPFSVKEISVSLCMHILLPVIPIFHQLVLLIPAFLLFYSFTHLLFLQMFMECLHMPGTVLCTTDSKAS